MPDEDENERTPLLRDVTKQQRQTQAQEHKVEDLGPFSDLVQPVALYTLIGDKDFDDFSTSFRDINKLLSELKTDAKAGLSADQVDVNSEERQHRIRIYGENKLPEKQLKSFLMMLWEAFNDKVLIILSVAAVVSFALGLYQDLGPSHDPAQPRVQWIEGVSIMVAILLVVFVSAVNDYQKELQFKKLNEKHDVHKVNVRRNGKSKSIDSTQLLVGDILKIQAGDMLTCDAIFINGHDVRVDESEATGESNAIRKASFAQVEKARADNAEKAPDCFLLSGSKIMEGECTAVVCAVGQDSFQGRIFMELRFSRPQETRMQKQLGEIAEEIAKYASLAGGLLFLALLIRFFIGLKTKPDRSGAEKGQEFIQIFVISITLIVVSVPEGLPLAVTLALAFATKRMTSHNLLVRVFQSCETMSNATVIVTDKTGTLTQNAMTVVALSMNDKVFRSADLEDAGNIQHSSNSDDLKFDKVNEQISDQAKDLLVKSIAINSTAFEDTNEEGDTHFIGSKTEIALLRFLQDMKWADYEQERNEADIIQSFPFSSDRKAMATIIKDDQNLLFLVKGAAEILLGKCDKRLLTGSNSKIFTEDLDEKSKEKLRERLESFSKQSLRNIAICYRKLDNDSDASDEESYDTLSESLTLLAVAGIEDPLREGVKESVNQCHKAGLNVMMCTGDNLSTAKAIAKQCGILHNKGECIEGAKFRTMSDKEKQQLVPQLKVLARSQPSDKAELISVLHDLDQIVGVTGDGTNDSLALKSADVGFSMGQAGTEVAKEASDIVLMDDNFSSVVNAIAWGRCVSDAVRKFLQFQLSVNLTAIVVTFVSAVTSGEENSVLNAVELLWVNLIMDTFSALALATDPASRSLLERKPESPDAPIIRLPMIKMILLQAAYQIALVLTLHFVGPARLRVMTGADQPSQREFNTFIFNCFVWCQIFNMINCRQLASRLNVFEGLHRNFWLLGILSIEVAGQIVIVFLGAEAFQTAPITGRAWLTSIIAGAVSLPLGLVIRLLPLEGFIELVLNRTGYLAKEALLPFKKLRRKSW